ncbi:MAG: DMT family transporter [Halodesulfurarchaeum sp.]|nr:DMT family transporter [Halodesulfurarchaeum sp.]
MDEEALIDIGLFLAYAVLGASSFVGAKAGLPYFPPLLFGALRLDLGAALLVGYVYATQSYWTPRTRTDVVSTLITGVFTVGLAIPLLYLGQQYVTSGVGSVVYSFTPILTGVAAIGLLPGVKFGFTDAIGFVFGLVGVAVVAGVDPGKLVTSDVRGVALIFGSAFVFALGNVVVQRIRPSLPSLTLTAWGLVLAALTSHAMSLATGESLTAIQWTTQAWLALMVTGVFASALYYAIHFELVSHIGSTRTNLVYYLMPISATIAGWLLLAEQITLPTITGFGLIFVGFVSLEYQSLRAAVRRESAAD